MRSQGITYVKIHKHICDKGYTGTVSSLRVFMQKEREHQKAYTSNNEEQLECIQRKHVCKLIYKKLKNVKEINKEQYDALIKTYPILKQIYTILADFYKMFYAKESNTLDHWIIDASALDIPELDSFINGLKKDIVAVKNGIRLTFNNGLAEGSVNKIKVIKRIMYGRNSFELLRAKILFNEYYFNHTSTLKPN